MRLQLYYTYISEAEYPHWAARLAELSPARQERVAAYRSTDDRAQSVAVTALLHYALSEWDKGADFGNEGVCFRNAPATALSALYPHWEIGENGRPFPAGIVTATGRVWVSVSHSGGHLLVAVADRPVGADVQATDHNALTPERFRRLDGRIRHPAEAPAATPAAVAARWAAKEAAVKLTGQGLATPFPKILVKPERILDETGTPHPLFLVERPAFVAAAVVKANIPAG